VKPIPLVLTKNQVEWMKVHLPDTYESHKNYIVEAWSPERLDLLL